jgi:hypothetical protein
MTTRFHLQRSLKLVGLALMSSMTLSGLENRHRSAPKGDGCRPAARPHKIEIKETHFANTMTSNVIRDLHFS